MVTDPDIHPSEGAFAPVTVTAPRGSRRESRAAGLDRERADRDVQPDHRHRASARSRPGIPDRVAAGELGIVQRLHARRARAARAYGTRPTGRDWVAILNPKGGWGGMDGQGRLDVHPGPALELPHPARRGARERVPGQGAPVRAAHRARGRRAPPRRLRAPARHRGPAALRALDLPRPEPRSRRSASSAAADGAPNLMYLQARRRRTTWEPLNSRHVEHAARGRRRGAHRDGDRRRLRRPARARAGARRRRRGRRLHQPRGRRGGLRRRSRRRPRGRRGGDGGAARASCASERVGIAPAAPEPVRRDAELRGRPGRPCEDGARDRPAPPSAEPRGLPFRGVPRRGPREPRPHEERQPRRSSRRRWPSASQAWLEPTGAEVTLVEIAPGRLPSVAVVAGAGRRTAARAQRPHGHGADRRRRACGRPIRSAPSVRDGYSTGAAPAT